MLNDEQKSRIELATLTIETAERGSGRAFLVAGGYIITAAHCVDYDLDGGIVLGDYILQFVETSDGKRFRVSPVMIDPVSDLAVLGFPDNQGFREDCEAFEAFIEATPFIEVEFNLPLTDEQLFVFTHLKTWIRGVAWLSEFSNNPSSVFTTMDEQITGGTSGSAVLNQYGKAVAIVSNVSDGGSDGHQPLIHQCLARFLYEDIRAANDSAAG